MPFVTAIVATVAAVVSTVVPIVTAIAATVASLVAPVVSAIATLAGVVVSTLSPAISTIVNLVGGVVELLSAGIQGSVELIKTTIAEPLGDIISGLKTAIVDMTTAITEPLKPILNPIKDSLISIKDFVVETKSWITAELAPVAELIQVVNSISAVVFIKSLIDGTAGITNIVGEVADESGAKTAQAIAMLYKDIVSTSIGTTTFIQKQSLALAETIDNYNENIRKDTELALGVLEKSLGEHITEVAMVIGGEVDNSRRKIYAIERRIEDLPHFQQMLINALA